jgi:hypothetical protein
MERTSLNNGAPFPDYVSPISETNSSKDDAFYSSILVDPNSQNPLENYERIKKEQEEVGYSITVEEAKQKWKQEQDFVTKESIQLLIENPTLDKENKKVLLNNYINNSTISNDLKDKVINELTNSYILENNLDNNDKEVESINLVVDKLKYEQHKEDFIENSKLGGINTSEVTPEELADKTLTVAQMIDQGIDFTNPSANYNLEAEYIWFLDMVVGKTPNYLKTFFETLAAKIQLPQTIIGKEVLKQLFTSEQLVNAGIDAGYDVRTLTEIRKDITARNEQNWTAEWRDTVADALDELGYSQELIHKTLFGRLFENIGEAFTYLGNTFASDNPQAVIMPLEGLLFGLPLLARGGKKSSVSSSGRKKATEAQKKAVRTENARQAAANAAKDRKLLENPEPKVKASKDINVKVNSPIATVQISNPKSGAALVDAIILDTTGQIGEAAGLTRPKLIHYLTDPNSNIIKSTEFGFTTDISRVTQIEKQAARDRAFLIENPNLTDTPAVQGMLDAVVLTVNGIVPEVPMIISNTFNTLRRTPTGISLSIPFMKSPNERYKFNEIVPAFDQVSKSISATVLDSPGAIKEGELLIQEIDTLGNVVNEFTPDSLPSYLTTDTNFLYHGFRTNDISTYIDKKGNLVLNPSKNFGGKVSSVSFTDSKVLADDYATRVKGGGPTGFNFAGAKVFKIKRSAVKNLEIETMRELAVNTTKPVIIPKGSFEIIDHPLSARAEQLTEVEIRNEINRINARQEITPIESSKEFIVRWQPDGDIYDSFSNSFGDLPSERFPTKSVTDSAQRYLYDTEVTHSSTGLINQLFTYGRYDKALEKRVYQDQLNRNGYFKQQEKQLQLAIKKNLSNKEQNELAKILKYQDSYLIDQLNPKQIADALGYVPKYSVLMKLQEAAGVYRVFENSKYQADNVTYGNLLAEAGYTKSFYIEPSIDSKFKTTEVMPVLEKFAIPKDTITIYTAPDDSVSSLLAFDFTTKKPISFMPERGYEKTHYAVGIDGMPNQQIYRLGKNYTDPVTGDIYQYGTFGTLKSQSLPNDLLPKREGHVPKMHPETYTILAIPLKFKINGQQVDFTKGRFINLGNKRILDVTGELVSKEMGLTRAEVIRDLQPFARVVAMRDSKAASYKWSRENISGNPDTLYILQKAKELTLNEVADFRIREVQSVQGQRLRNESLDYKIESDPYETAIRTGTSIGQLAYGQIGLNQLKKEWTTTYKTNEPRINIIDNPISNKDINSLDMESQAAAKSEFPLDVTQIKDVPGFEEFGRQVRADYMLIYNKEMTSASWDTKAAILGIRKLTDQVGNLTENNKFTSWMAKGAREIQRNPQQASGALLKTVTTFQLMVNMPKQLFLQGMAPLSGLLTVSKNPIEFFENIHFAIGIMSRQLSKGAQLKKGQFDLDKVHDYLFEQENLAKNQIEGFLIQEKIKLKLTGKDYDLLVDAITESAFGNVSDHIFTQGLGLNSIAKLGESKGPVNWLLESLAEYGFELGELISRDGHVIVALRNWIDLNPGKNWRTKPVLDQIMNDAYKLSGSMTSVTTMAWQNSLSLRTVGQFQSFLMRMNEAAVNPNATPFTAKRRWKNVGYNYALYGTTFFGLHTLLIRNLEEDGNESLYDIAQMLKYTNLFYQLNYIGDYIFGNDTQGRTSESVFGDIFGLYGGLDQMAGPWSTISATILGFLADDVDTRNVGATIAFVKKAYGIEQEIAEMWIRNPEAHKEERLLTSLIAISDLLPPVRGAINLKQELEAKHRRASATGHDYGLDFTTSELVFQNLWGVQTKQNKILWELATSERERGAALKVHAKRFMTIMSRKSDGSMPDYFTVARSLTAYKLILDNKGFIQNSQEHNEFVDEVMSLMGRQKTPVAENFIKKYMDRLMTGQDFSGKELTRFRQAIEVAPVEEDERANLNRMLDSITNNQGK